MNMASLWKLPVIYVCENNLYNEYTHYLETTAGDIALRASAFGIPFHEADGQDARSVYESAHVAVEHARAGEGPSFLLYRTYRQHGHHVGDVDRAYYRPKDEERSWKDRDPLKLLAQVLVAEGAADAVTFDRIEEEVRTEISEGVRFALDAPYPGPEEVLMHVYSS
jgi:pyruvate dehydrogenase E1 component alpha subunit